MNPSGWQSIWRAQCSGAPRPLCLSCHLVLTPSPTVCDFSLPSPRSWSRGAQELQPGVQRLRLGCRAVAGWALGPSLLHGAGLSPEVLPSRPSSGLSAVPPRRGGQAACELWVLGKEVTPPRTGQGTGQKEPWPLGKCQATALGKDVSSGPSPGQTVGQPGSLHLASSPRCSGTSSCCPACGAQLCELWALIMVAKEALQGTDVRGQSSRWSLGPEKCPPG